MHIYRGLPGVNPGASRYTHVCMYIYVCMYMYTYIHMYVCIFMYVCIYIYIYICIGKGPFKVHFICYKGSLIYTSGFKPGGVAVYVYVYAYLYICLG